MKLSELRKRYESKGVHFSERWGSGFIVTGKSEKHIRKTLEPMFALKGIGTGPNQMNKDYRVSLYACKGP